MVFNKVNKNNLLSIKLTSLFLFLIAIRPIIDLHGKYEGKGINAGGLYGIIFIILILCSFCMRPQPLPHTIIICFFNIIFLTLIHIFNLLINLKEGFNFIDFAHFITGFSVLPLLAFTIRNNIKAREIAAYKFYYIFSICCFIPIIITFLQLIGIVPYTYFDNLGTLLIGRPSGGYFHPSSLARLMIFLCIYSYIFIYTKKYSNHFFYFIIFLSLITTIISTHRTSFIIILIVIVILEGYNISFSFLHSRNMRKRIILVSGLLILSTIIFSLISSTLWSSIILLAIENSPLVGLFSYGVSTIFSDTAMSGDFLRGRGGIWRNGLQLFFSCSLGKKIFGFGYAPFELHNNFLEILVVNGILGLLLFSIIFFGLFLWMWNRSNTRGRVIIFSLNVYLILFAIPLEPTTYPNFMWWFFSGYAMILCILPKSKNININTLYFKMKKIEASPNSRQINYE